MFIVSLKDGTTLKEGVDVKNWDEIPVGIEVLGVTLTDYGSLNHNLTGYDSYVVVYKASSRVVHGGGGGVKPPVIEAQTLYGIRDDSPSKPQIQKVAARLRQTLGGMEIEVKGERNLILLQTRMRLETELDQRLKQFLSDLNATEVTEINFGFTVNQFSRSELSQSPKGLRSGIPSVNGPEYYQRLERYLLNTERIDIGELNNG